MSHSSSHMHVVEDDVHEHHHGCDHEHHHDCDHEHHHECEHGHQYGCSHGLHHENHWNKAGLGLLWGIGLLLISIGGFNIPLIANYLIAGLNVLVTAYVGRTVYQAAWQAARNKKWDMTTLYSISTSASLLVSVLGLFLPGLPMMTETASLILGFWHLGEAIEHSLIGEITKKLDIRECAPPFIQLKGNPNRRVSIKELKPNNIIIVEKGVVIPVDGVLKNPALLYTTMIDGSPRLKSFKSNDVVKAGMRLADHISPVEILVTKTFADSYLSTIAKNIDKANEEKAPVELLANQVLRYFIPGLLAVATVSGVAMSLLFSPALAIQCVVSVLVSACPCALSLITPMAIKIGMLKATKHGVNFNNGKALQAAADIDTVVFDLNGTLTKGEMVVKALHIENKSLLHDIALLESQSEHPVAKIITSHITSYLKDLGVARNIPLEKIYSVDKSHHSGIKGVINQASYMIGNKDMLWNNGIKVINKPYDDPKNGSIYIVKDNNVIGQIALTDPLREDAIATVNQLQRLGKTVHICTGSDSASAEKYAKILGIDKSHICANTVGVATNTNEISKASYIEQLKAKGFKVAMVGDAANDIGAIACSDVGVAVKSSIGGEITQQHAGIVVQQGLLFPIATAFDVADKTKQNIVQNLWLSLTYNSVVTLIASGLFTGLGITLNPVFGVVLVILESTMVLANVYRLKQKDVLFEPSKADNIRVDEEDYGNTTSNVLDALSHSTKNCRSFVDVPSENKALSFPSVFSSRNKTYLSNTLISSNSQCMSF